MITAHLEMSREIMDIIIILMSNLEWERLASANSRSAKDCGS